MFIGRRWHYFEIHDQPWCPSVIRSLLVETLHVGWTMLPLPSLALVHLVRDRVLRLLQQDGLDCVVDMCSGGGGPLPTALMDRPSATPLNSHASVRLLLTDYFPQPGIWSGICKRHSNVTYCSAPVDATKLLHEHPEVVEFQRHGRCLRTICGAAHHFKPDELALILKSAVTAGDSIMLIEAIERTPQTMLVFFTTSWAIALAAPLYLLWSSVAGRSRDHVSLMARCFFTYLVPVVPLIMLHDSMVSALRTYSPDEFLEITRSIDPLGTYHWRVERTVGPTGLGAVLFYTGSPKVVAQTVQSQSN